MKLQHVQHEKIENPFIVLWDEDTCRRRFWRSHRTPMIFGQPSR